MHLRKGNPTCIGGFLESKFSVNYIQSIRELHSQFGNTDSPKRIY